MHYPGTERKNEKEDVSTCCVVSDEIFFKQSTFPATT